MHLTPEELIDIVEGDEPESASRHLRSCATCRDELSSLRAAIVAAAEVDMPEPSPLFWGHFSERVRTAVVAEKAPGGQHAVWGSGWLPRWSTVSTAVVAAAVALAVYVTAPRRPLAPAPGDDAAALPEIETALMPLGSVDDPSLALVAGLTEQLDAESVTETTWTDHVGAVDEVVFTLTDEERMELQRLLQEALDKRGA
jgi:hypothetical protein